MKLIAKQLRIVRSLILFGITLFHNFTFADIVTLNNGDRISGTITRLTGNSLKINTAYAGTFEINTDAIHSFSTTLKQHWQINLKSRDVLVNESNKRGHIVIDGKTIPIMELSLIPSHHNWERKGLLETSLDVDNDQNRKQKLHVNAELNLESKQWRHSFKAESKRDKDRSRVTEDTVEASYTLDFLLDSHWLLRSDNLYREEGVDIVSQYWNLGAGPGYRLWGEGKDRLDTIITYNRLWLKAGPTELEFGAWAFALNYKQLWLNEKLETFSDIHISDPIIDQINYITNTSSGLRYYFQHNIHISFKYDYNETRFKFGLIKDSSYVLGVGVSF
ncbi:MAG TPA: DUF481 domain-containing protein [Cellvibrio sp.]|nr:DUF481 domain-containing protein [Cellvibrio sp.]